MLDAELARFIASGEDQETPVLSGERVLLVHGDRVRVDGREVGSIAILRDRTELETTLRELEGAQGLAEGLRAQSHEFSNKLHVMSGLLELGHVDAAIAFIERVGSGGALSSLDEHDGIADVETAALVLAKRSRAQELGITLELDPESHLDAPSADAPRTDLLTVVGNLLDNAIEACVLGGRITISIRDDREPGVVVVEVDDDGPGVPVDRRHAIFEPDISAKAPTPGKARRGIGLTIVQRVARRLGGSASVDRPPPAARGSPCGCRGRRPRTPRRRRSREAAVNDIRVVVVDDDFAVARVNRAFVDAQPGFTVVAEAHTGGDALEPIELHRPQLVLLDVYLPDLGGLDVLRHLRATGDDVEVIAVTAARDLETVRRHGCSAWALPRETVLGRKPRRTTRRRAPRHRRRPRDRRAARPARGRPGCSGRHQRRTAAEGALAGEPRPRRSLAEWDRMPPPRRSRSRSACHG